MFCFFFWFMQNESYCIFSCIHMALVSCLSSVWQLLISAGHPKVFPKDFVDPEVSHFHKDDYMFMGCIEYINEVRRLWVHLFISDCVKILTHAHSTVVSNLKPFLTMSVKWLFVDSYVLLIAPIVVHGWDKPAHLSCPFLPVLKFAFPVTDFEMKYCVSWGLKVFGCRISFLAVAIIAFSAFVAKKVCILYWQKCSQNYKGNLQK